MRCIKRCPRKTCKYVCLIIFGIWICFFSQAAFVYDRWNEVAIPMLKEEAISNGPILKEEAISNGPILKEEAISNEFLNDLNIDKKQSFHSSADNINNFTIIGNIKTQKTYLTIGIPSAHRINGCAYLVETLNFLINKTSSAEKTDIRVIIFLVDFDLAKKQQTINTLENKFDEHLKSGYINIIHLENPDYPPLNNLKLNFNDSPKRVAYRSKQNIDFSLLFAFCSNISSQYYMHLEDDLICADKFYSHIVEYIKSQKRPWVMIEFSSQGFIGKLLLSENLAKFAKLLRFFYDEKPCDWLMNDFLNLMNQRKRIIRKTAIFQHLGTIRTFQENDKPFISLDKTFKMNE